MCRRAVVSKYLTLTVQKAVEISTPAAQSLRTVQRHLEPFGYATWEISTCQHIGTCFRKSQEKTRDRPSITSCKNSEVHSKNDKGTTLVILPKFRAGVEMAAQVNMSDTRVQMSFSWSCHPCFHVFQMGAQLARLFWSPAKSTHVKSFFTSRAQLPVQWITVPGYFILPTLLGTQHLFT